MRHPTPRDVWRARARIHGLARRTPILDDVELSGRLGTRVVLKDETVQPTGAFKQRGAASKLTALVEEVRERGVVAVSTGNHGRAVADVARRLGARATVFVSERVPGYRVRALEEAGAVVVVGGEGQDAAERSARARIVETGATFVPPFDDPHVIAGQGTLGLELLEDLPEVASAVVPLSGGGLIAGVALALKAADPSIRVVGVSMQHGAAMHASLRAGEVRALAEADTLADSLQGGLGEDNRYTFPLVRELVDDVVLVSEASIAEGMRHAFHAHRRVLEGAAAVGIGALLDGSLSGLPGPVALIASGANVDPDAFLRVLEGGPA